MSVRESDSDVLLLRERIGDAELRQLVERFEDMVKYVVDVSRGVVAIGGEMQSDAEQYVSNAPDPKAHARAFRALLQLHPEAWRQLPYVTGAAR